MTTDAEQAQPTPLAERDPLEMIRSNPEAWASLKAALTAEVLQDLDPLAVNNQMPGNAFRGGDGNWYHRVMMTPESLGAKPIEKVRPLATNLEEAREKHWDYYHPVFGLIWNGAKLARDRSISDIMNDSSVGGLTPKGELPVTAAGFEE